MQSDPKKQDIKAIREQFVTTLPLLSLLQDGADNPGGWLSGATSSMA